LDNHQKTELVEQLPSYLARHLENHPYEDFILARALEIVKERGLTIEDAIGVAFEEFSHIQRNKKSKEGFYNSLGGALLSVGLGAWIAGRYFMTIPYSYIQLLPFLFIALIGLFLMFEARRED
jgi:hypothetical protein